MDSPKDPKLYKLGPQIVQIVFVFVRRFSTALQREHSRLLPSSSSGGPGPVDLAGRGRRPGDKCALESPLLPLAVLLHDAERQLVDQVHRRLGVTATGSRVQGVTNSGKGRHRQWHSKLGPGWLSTY